ncbi:hypothetical protein PINS_up009311 [Pythium insidiosum]|nr:hypothetical protein PINS_up009311 [Pythium insidiosum]
MRVDEGHWTHGVWPLSRSTRTLFTLVAELMYPWTARERERERERERRASSGERRVTWRCPQLQELPSSSATTVLRAVRLHLSHHRFPFPSGSTVHIADCLRREEGEALGDEGAAALAARMSMWFAELSIAPTSDDTTHGTWHCGVIAMVASRAATATAEAATFLRELLL